MIASGAKHLGNMRVAGKRPPGFVVVTDSREIAENARQRDLYPVVFEPGARYDWRVLHGLDVRLVTCLQRAEVAEICQHILEVNPATFHATYFGEHETEHDTIIGEAYAAR
jgi:hypothetical protein